eukprot:3999120-Heterocapsa_arctica.AAC.1
MSQGQLAASRGGFAKWQAEAMGGKGIAPGPDDTWCLCGMWVFASATFCVCGLPTGRCRQGDWQCTDCRKTNFGGKGRGASWCKKCGKVEVKDGMLAYGDDTLNRGRQQFLLQPRNAELARQKVVDSACLGRMPRRWTHTSSSGCTGGRTRKYRMQHTATGKQNTSSTWRPRTRSGSSRKASYGTASITRACAG